MAARSNRRPEQGNLIKRIGNPPHRLAQPLSATADAGAIHVFVRGRPVTAAGRLNWVAIPPRAKRGNNLTLKRRIERSYDTIKQCADRKSLVRSSESRVP